jgi:hypothetical protein
VSRRVRIAWALVFAAALWYGIACQRACIADQDGCRAAMIRYDGFVPAPAPDGDRTR